MTRYIFCATTGFNMHRVLNWIFYLADKTETENTNPGTIIEKYLMGMYVAFNNYETKKALYNFNQYKNHIDHLLDFNRLDRYFAANEYFIQSYAKIACAIFENEIGILHLIGNPIDTSLRMLEKGIIPTYESTNILNLKFPTNRIKPTFIKYREYRHKFFRALWYCLEIYVRSKDLIATQKAARHYVFFEKWMEDKVEIEYMLRRFGIKLSKEKLISATKARQNFVQLRNTKFVGKTIPRIKAEEAALRFIDRFGDQLQLRKEECHQLLEI